MTIPNPQDDQKRASDEYIDRLFKEQSELQGMKISPLLPNLRAFLMGAIFSQAMMQTKQSPTWILNLIRGKIIEKETLVRRISLNDPL